MDDVENPNYRYGQWAGNEKGQPQNPERCVAKVYPARAWVASQCSFKRK